MQEGWHAHTDQLQPFFLPAYAPQLNLIERLWRHLKDKFACHRWWNDLQRSSTIFTDLQGLPQAAQTLLLGLAVHFHAADGPAFRPLHNFCENA